MYNKNILQEIVRERRTLGQSYITESFASSKLNSLFKDKENLKIFKDYVINHKKEDVFTFKPIIGWSNIQDDCINIINVSDEVNNFVKDGDINHIYNIVSSDNSANDVLVYVNNDGEIDTITQNRINIYPIISNYQHDTESTKIFDIKDRKIIIDGISSIFSLRTKGLKDIREYLFIENDKVHILKTLYKFIVIGCYESEHGRFSNFGNFIECFINMPWIPDNVSAIEMLLRYIGDVKETNYRNFTYSINGEELSFKLKGLSEDNIKKRLNEYAQKLYDIDVNREIVNNFPFKSIVGELFSLAQDATRALDIIVNDRMGTWKMLKTCIVDIDSELPLEYFAVSMFINNQDFFRTNEHDLYRSVSLIEYVNRGLNAYVYKIEPNSKHITNYIQINRQRQLNKNITVDRDNKNDIDAYNELKDMTQYLYHFKDDIRKLSKSLPEDGTLIIRTYNDIMVLERQKLSYKQMKELNPLIDEYITFIGEIVHEKEMPDGFIQLVNKIKNLYVEVIGRYDGYFGGE